MISSPLVLPLLYGAGVGAAAAVLLAAELQPLRPAAPDLIRRLPSAGTLSPSSSLLSLSLLLRGRSREAEDGDASGAVAVRDAARGGGCALCRRAVLPAQILLDIIIVVIIIVESCTLTYNIVSVLILYLPLPKEETINSIHPPPFRNLLVFFHDKHLLVGHRIDSCHIRGKLRRRNTNNSKVQQQATTSKQ